jgi:hypothetical protein
MPRTFGVPLGHLAFDDVRVGSTPAHGVKPPEEMDDGPTPGGVGGVSVLGENAPRWATERRAMRSAATNETLSGSSSAWMAASHMRVRVAK